jgi:hypothetical protein
MARGGVVGVATAGDERIAALRIIAANEMMILMPAASNQRVHKDHCRCQVGYKCAHKQLTNS